MDIKLLDEYSNRYKCNIECEYDLDNPDILFRKRFRQTQVHILNQLNFNFRWKSNIPEIIIPRNYEILNRILGITGFLKSEKVFCKLAPVKLDANNDVDEWNALGFGTKPVNYGKQDKYNVIPCYNNPLGLPDIGEINYFAYEKSQNDISRMYQLVNSRNIPWLKTDSDKVKQEVEKAMKAYRAGKPFVISTRLIDELQKLDILDPNNIAKMEYLTSYDEVLDKNIANRFGASLDIKDKKAQVNNAELKAYDDITTMNYLVNYECRLEFVNKMKEAGFDIDVIASPIFADEPDEDEINNPDLLDNNLDDEELKDEEDMIDEKD